MGDQGEAYEGWSPQQLIQKIKELESKLQTQTSTTIVSPDPTPQPLETTPQDSITPLPYRKPPKQAPKTFDFSKYSTRLIALKFAYLGQRYNGFEHHKNNKTPLPTIEEEIWKALMKTRLINPTPVQEGEDTQGDRPKNSNRIPPEALERDGADVNWEGCEYSKCGRTDRGVSAFGQVIGIRVRSNRPAPKAAKPSAVMDAAQETEDISTGSEWRPLEPETEQQSESKEPPFDPIANELPYIQILNRVLPPDIRILAWCPNPPPDFSARFSCKERRYKYFFTNPCFTPVPGSSGLYPSQTPNADILREGWLDIEAMREGCRNLVGLHDFRNFCKIDVSKQITNFQRRIFHADIEEICPLSMPAFIGSNSLQQSTSSAEQPKIYAFVVHGSAFLWHQVRSLIAILFRVGQGLESPDLVKQLLDIKANPTRPKYEMASDAPLVLWDCIFPAKEEVQDSNDREHGYVDALNWIYVGDEGGEEKSGKAGIGRGKWGRGGVMDDLWEVWRGRKIEEILAGGLMDVVAAQGQGMRIREEDTKGAVSTARGVRVFEGADGGKSKGNYVQILDMERMERVEVMNDRYAKKKGWDPARPRGRGKEGEGNADE
ncbi:pseudouridine synthase [Delitschia confertaspora ATCC 74209]|uniref:Pseudouridine synthase n=1 Tax=Delitschia confertaspora ATCC 74209 TaxID=1513339 RepID=A0A9P4JKJ0_9PLEO|nr:pseudouridine synthase [Delitschia confertaspora ATCC 74209]